MSSWIDKLRKAFRSTTLLMTAHGSLEVEAETNALGVDLDVQKPPAGLEGLVATLLAPLQESSS